MWPWLLHPFNPRFGAIANRTRLQIFDLLLQRPGLTVSIVAASLKHPLSLTSEYLRALEARGLLAVRRVGKRVKYSPADTVKNQNANPLVAALRKTFMREKEPVEAAFTLATAFTHPRRIEIVRSLQLAPRTSAQIQTATGIPARTLSRHLRKLERRGFVVQCLGGFAVANRTDALAQELVRMAMK